MWKLLLNNQQEWLLKDKKRCQRKLKINRVMRGREKGKNDRLWEGLRDKSRRKRPDPMETVIVDLLSFKYHK